MHNQTPNAKIENFAYHFLSILSPEIFARRSLFLSLSLSLYSHIIYEMC